MHANSQSVVCVPARNEAQRLPTLLAALAAQTHPATIVIALNNTSDASTDAIEDACRNARYLNVVIDDATFTERESHAGRARRQAMEVGAAIAGRDGILITTDADARPPPEWVAENIAALARGLDIVGGRIRLDDAENIPDPIKTCVALTDRYWTEIRAIEDAIDPISWDPPPRHGDHTGASLALRVRDYLACGGVPCIPSGEDRALVQAVQLRGGRLGHPAGVWTRVSARTVGRAASGMADAMARFQNAAGQAPVMLPHFRHWSQRAHWRRDIRMRFGSAEVAAREAALVPMPCDMALTPDTFVGQATA